MKKLKKDEMDNNFQFEIITWNKIIAIKIRGTKCKPQFNLFFLNDRFKLYSKSGRAKFKFGGGSILTKKWWSRENLKYHGSKSNKRSNVLGPYKLNEGLMYS